MGRFRKPEAAGPKKVVSLKYQKQYIHTQLKLV